MADKTEGTVKKRPWWKKLRVLIAALVLAGGGGAGLLGWNYYMGSNAANAAGPEAGRKQESSQNSESGQGAEVKATLSLEPFLVNLADTQETRFVKVTFQLGLTENKEEFTKSPVAIAASRDAIITLLSSKTSDQILTVEGKNKLRREVRDRVNNVVSGSKAKVQDVYIVEFVVQL